MSLSKRIGYNTLYQLLGKAVSALATFIVLGLVARRFGEEGTGEFTLVLSYVALFYLFADFGFNAVVVKKMIAEKKKAPFFFRNLLGLRMAWAGVLIFLAFFISRALPYSAVFKSGVFLTLLTILTQAILTTGNAFFQSRLRYDLSVIASSLGSLTTLLLVFFLVFKRAALVKILIAYPLGGLVVALATLLTVRRLQITVFPRFDFNFWRFLFGATLPLALTLVVDVLHFKIDTFLLAYFRPMAEVGVYNLAYKIFENALVFPVFFVNSVYPVLVSDHARGIKRLQVMVKKAFRFLLLTAVISLLVLFSFAPLMIRLLVGKGFGGSVLALRILSLSLPAFFVSALFMWVLITLGRRWLLFRIYSLAMILDLILNIALIPKFGYLAAAITTGATEGIILLLESYFVWKFLKEKS